MKLFQWNICYDSNLWNIIHWMSWQSKTNMWILSLFSIALFTVNFIAMSRFRFTAIRQSEDLILNDEPKVYINGPIVQYLLTHQINGIHLLYENYKKVCWLNHNSNWIKKQLYFVFQRKSTILNDENGSGKCFQCVAFLNAILNCSSRKKILIICQLNEKLLYWKYHIDNLLENASSRIADDQNDVDQGQSLVAVTIASIDYVLSNLPTFTAHEFDILILQDQYLQISAKTFKRLMEIKTTSKILLCSNNLIVSLMAQFKKYIYKFKSRI